MTAIKPSRSAASGTAKKAAARQVVEPHAKISLEHAVYGQSGFLARRLQQIGVSIFLEETEALDITPLQYAVMAAARAAPGVDQIGVSDNVGLDRTTVVGIVDRLERKGLMKRRADPHDRRVRQLFLTDAGQTRLVELQPALDHVHRRLLDPLTEDERESLMRLIGKVVSYHNEDSRVPIGDAALRATITGARRAAT
jgi:DNA-binding MarR family transcriptional regulator